MNKQVIISNRFSTAMKRMKGCCPEYITAYALCITTTESLEKGSCQQEFQALKKCFKSVLKI